MRTSTNHIERRGMRRDIGTAAGACKLAVLLVAAALSACGGGDSAPLAVAPTQSEVLPQVSAVTPVPTSAPVAGSSGTVPMNKSLLTQLITRPAAALATPIVGAADSGMLLLLVPDNASLTDAGITAWVDAASEVGTRIMPITDSQFLALGTTGALAYAGLVLPDMVHSIATDDIVAAVRAYTNAGGKTFLTFDFAALTLNANNQPVYPIPKSRLSDLAGVDYVLYDKYRDQTTGLGPVVAMTSTLRELLVPPGKSEPYPPPAVATPTPAPTVVVNQTKAKATGTNVPLLDAAGVAPGQALYLAPSIADPGGVHGFDPQQFQMLPSYSVIRAPGLPPSTPRTVSINFGSAFKAPVHPTTTTLLPRPTATQPLVVSSDDSASTTADASSDVQTQSGVAAKAAVVDQMEAYSGYLLGYLIYPTYQTEGTYAGTTLATSPNFGLVAGVSSYGAGKVMFVNLPLGYLKGRTDALPMHGFLNYFVKNVLNSMRLSGMPNAVPGITLNWHLDAMEAQAPMLALEKAGIFKTKNFSMHITAGPDTVTIGDGLGFNLDHNPTAQAFLRRMDKLGHAVGSHGGWDHDYYGLNASETNEATFLPYLIWNRTSVDTVLGHPSRDYSAPEGNNPTWAMAWLESQGVVGAYFAGHTGLGVTRQYRDNMLETPKLWVSPVTPFGNYATYEEWQDFNVPKADVSAWYQQLIDFDIAQNTARMVYAHPPGAYDWLDVLKQFIAYGNSKGASKFKWYTIQRLADFLATRNQVSWSQTPLTNGATRVAASHPVSLAEMVWLLPKNRYLKPTGVTGASVADGGAYWLVKAKAVTSLQFDTKPNPTYVPS